MSMLQNKVAIVTGGASGIGRAAALLFAQEGACVTVADISEATGLAVANEIKTHGGRAIFAQTDVSVASDVQAMVAATLSAFGHLDVAFNNAGFPGRWSNVVGCAEAEWDKVFAVNVKGTWLCMKYEIEAMIANGAGSIVNTSSTAGASGSPNMAAYTSSKHAVIGLTRSAALDFAGKNIRVNAILPGSTDTPMVRDALAGLGIDATAVAAALPMRRIGQPDEPAEAALFLCSDRASFITGALLPVDGGFLIP